jgi:trehalose 6-phosphate phosphatase
MNAQEALDYVAAAHPLALITDFDGTISKIAPTPEEAVVHARCRLVIARLARHLPLVAIVSGRQVSEVRRLVGLPGVIYVGNHGLCRWESGHTHMEPSVLAHLEEIRGIAEMAHQRLTSSWLRFEEKDTGVSIHYRSAPDPASAKKEIISLLEDLTRGMAVEVLEGRRVVELRPAVHVDKGTAVFELLQDRVVGGAIYAGDDTTDLHAFAGLRRWAEQEEKRSLAVAVDSREMPPELGKAADLVVDGVEGWAGFLNALEDTLVTGLDS